MKPYQFSLRSYFLAVAAIALMLCAFGMVDWYMAARYERITGYPPNGRFGWFTEQYAATPSPQR